MWNEQKRAVLEALLPMCPYLALATDVEGVELPDRVMGDERVLIVRVGRDPDVVYTEGLTFGVSGLWGVLVADHSTCYAPWTAVCGYWVAAPFLGPSIQWPEPKIRLRAGAVSEVLTHLSHLRAIK